MRRGRATAGPGREAQALRVKRDKRSREGTPGGSGCWAASAQSRRTTSRGSKGRKQAELQILGRVPRLHRNQAAGLEVRAGRQSWGLCRDSTSVPWDPPT